MPLQDPITGRPAANGAHRRQRRGTVIIGVHATEDPVKATPSNRVISGVSSPS